MFLAPVDTLNIFQRELYAKKQQNNTWICCIHLSWLVDRLLIYNSRHAQCKNTPKGANLLYTHCCKFELCSSLTQTRILSHKSLLTGGLGRWRTHSWWGLSLSKSLYVDEVPWLAKHERLSHTTRSLWNCDFSAFLVWFGWNLKKKKVWVCVNFPHSMRGQRKLEQQTRYDDRISQLRPKWNFPSQMKPLPHRCHCLPVNSEFTPRKTKALLWSHGARLMMQRAEVGWRGGPLPLSCVLCWQLPGKRKQQEVEWKGITPMAYICLLMGCFTTWRLDGNDPDVFVRFEPIKTFGALEFMAFSLLFLAL